MQGGQKDIKRRFRRKSEQSGLVTVVLAALLLEAIAAIQYRYTRGMMERNLEQQVLIMLRASAMRMDGNLPLSTVHDRASAIERRLKERFGSKTHVTLHMEPLKSTK